MVRFKFRWRTMKKEKKEGVERGKGGRGGGGEGWEAIGRSDSFT